MSSPAGHVLLVDADATRRRNRQFALESSHGQVVFAVETVRAARDCLAANQVQLVITSASIGDSDAVALLRRVPHETAAAPSVIVLADPDEHGLRRLAWSEGAVAVLTEPIDDSELGAVVRRVTALRERRLEAVHAEQSLAASLDHLTDLLVLVLDAAVTGSASRGTQLVGIVTALAADFKMEETFEGDLRRAARLHEIGRVAIGHQGGWTTTGHASLASARLIAPVPSLAGVAEIIAAIGANWDGSGIPAGVQRGQIPVRSRLLRVGIDLLTAIEKGDPTGDAGLGMAVQQLRARSGQWYDPAVVASLSTLVALDHPATGPSKTRQVSYDQLAVGMRLATDLHTVSGVKLLAEGTVLNDASLQLIHRRHELDPLVLPATIERATGV